MRFNTDAVALGYSLWFFFYFTNFPMLSCVLYAYFNRLLYGKDNFFSRTSKSDSCSYESGPVVSLRKHDKASLAQEALHVLAAIPVVNLQEVLKVLQNQLTRRIIVIMAIR